MDTGNGSKNKKLDTHQHTSIARAIFAAAESMGISDRHQVDEITSRVIERWEEESPHTLPGMEDLVPKRSQKGKGLPSGQEIHSMVKEILAEGREVVPEKSQSGIEARVNMTAPSNVQSASIIKLSENARLVLAKRYLKKDKNGEPIEIAEDMFRRVASTIAAAELIYNSKADIDREAEEFYQVMTELDFLPNSPTLMNAGRELGQLSACFVLPVEDSMESIFNAVKYTALIHKSGGGTGFSFSRLRPERDRVGSTGGVASGPISFMKVFDSATDVIKQGGMRRGANMAILRVDHPDIKSFIEAKKDLSTLTNFNLSVAVTDRFMEALQSGGDYELINPRTGDVHGTLNAGEVFDMIVDNAWATGDPGVVFIDEINRGNPTPALGEIESTNPCGEQPLMPYESCNLGSINLTHMLKTADGTPKIDYSHLSRIVRAAVRFLDNVIDVNKFPLTEIEEMTRKTRKTGLGVMGYADMLLQLGIPYDSEEAINVASSIMQFISEEASKTSMELAEERGVFPAFSGSIYDTPGGPRVRNASRTTIAPTGTLSIIAGCSSGIEPLFALSYTRNILDGAQLIEVNPYFERAAREGGFYSPELMKSLATGTPLNAINEIPDDVKRLFVTAHDISPEWHVRTQAAFQNFTDNAVSKTVNFPHQATRDDVAKVYMLAYEEGLKGITIYRDGSRENQVLTTSASKSKTEVSGITPRKRSKITTGITEMVNTGCGHLYVTVNSDEQGILEVFSHLGKTGGCATAQLEAICRLISIALRAGVDVSSIFHQLRGIRCPSLAWEEGKSILSCADAIASVLEKHTTGYDGKPRLEDYGLSKNPAGQCPDCGTLLVYEEGCFKCPSCGYTKC